MTAIAGYRGRLRVNAIPLNTQKFKVLLLNDNVVLLDSLAFLNGSLDKLVGNLNASAHPFPLLRKWLPDDRERALILRKGVYPYEFMDGMAKLEAALPPREEFYSQLSQSHASEQDYEHALEVWRVFGCRTMEDYTKIYVRADTYQLAEAVLDFRARVWTEYALDIAHYWSTPMLTKDVMLKTTGVRMELLTDLEQVFFFKNALRGGVSYVNVRHFDVEEEREKRGEGVVATYVDANNLYGAAMRFPMPLDDFRWMSEDELERFDPARDCNTQSDVGYVLEVDLDYPESLHLAHNSFPLAPEHLEIDESMLSPYAASALHELTRKKVYRAKKLGSTFRPRRKYVCHGLNLALYLKHGLELKRLRRGIRFRQSRFIKPYIDALTAKRAAALTELAKQLYKLLANSLFGKMIEGGATRMDCRFVRSLRQALRRNTDPRLLAHMIYSDTLSLAFMGKRKTKLHQNWAVGFSILEVSKYIMQRLFYEVIQPAFGGRASVLLSDTDSFVLALPGASEDAALARLACVMDFSNYEPQHALFSTCVKNLTGYLKNELPSARVVEVIGVRSKVYMIRTDRGEEARCKGVKGRVKDLIPAEGYRKVVRGERVCEQRVTQHVLQSAKHVNRLLKQRKLAFSSFDDKRYLLCSVHSVPYGSSLIALSNAEGRCYFCARPMVFS